MRQTSIQFETKEGFEKAMRYIEGLKSICIGNGTYFVRDREVPSGQRIETGVAFHTRDLNVNFFGKSTEAVEILTAECRAYDDLTTSL